MNVAILSLLALLPACSLSWPDLPSFERAPPFAGAVVADEPKAAMIGADMLAAGATAADAAVATYFALAVTLPASAGLGGGGVCLGYDAKSDKSEAIDFMPRATAGGGMTVPSAVRGMAIVHNRWGGQISWPRLVTPGEILARNGMPVSRALHQQAGNASVMAKLDGDASRLFLSAAGKLYPEGTILRQIDLAGILGRIAARGGGEFYTGPLARRIVDAARHSGYDLSLADLRDAIPRIVTPVTLALSAQRRYLLAPVDGGAIIADMLAMLAYGKFAGQEPPRRPHLMAEAQARAYAAYARRLQGDADTASADARAKQLMDGFRSDANNAPVGWSIPDERLPPGAGFSVVDKAGNAVSCALTMMAPMGSGRVLLNTGILAAPPPSGEVASLIPLILADSVKKQAVMTLAASGGRAAAAAAAQVAMSLTAEEYPLEDALYRPRMLADEGGALRLEPDAGDSAAVLREQGHALVMTPDLGRVNVIFCPTQQALPGGCARLADPRGAGLALTARR